MPVEPSNPIHTTPERARPAAEPCHGQPLSQSLEALLREESDDGQALTLNQIFARTEGRGIHLVIVLLSLPFLIPVSIPGVSTLFGVVVGWLAARLALNLPASLPRCMGDRPLPHGFQHKVLASGRRVLIWIEKISSPRRTTWMTWRASRMGNGLLLLFLAFLLALPIPPIVPFTNTLPGIAILLVAVSMMEEDGVLIWLGYAAVALSLGYFWLMGDLIWRGLTRLFSMVG